MPLHERAVLVSLNISQWSGSKSGRKEAAELAAMKNASPEDVRCTKRLFDKELLADIGSIASKARSDHKRLTLPWGEDRTRILSMKLHFEHLTLMAGYQQDFHAAVDVFLNSYEAKKIEALASRGTLVTEEEYPSLDALRNKFSFNMEMNPVPQVTDFRVDISEEEQAAFAKNVEAKTAEANREIWTRLYDVVEAMATSLEEYRVTPDGVEKPFRDSLVENVLNMAKALPELNITADEDMDRMSESIRKRLCSIQAQHLRDYPSLRTTTAAAAREVLSEIHTKL